MVSTLGIRHLGLGTLIGVSGLAMALFSRRGLTGGAIPYALVSASRPIAGRFIAGRFIDRTGLFGPAAADVGPVKVLGVALIPVGGLLLVCA